MVTQRRWVSCYQRLIEWEHRLFLAMFETDRLTDQPTNQTIDRQMDKPSYRGARTHLKYGMWKIRCIDVIALIRQKKGISWIFAVMWEACMDNDVEECITRLAYRWIDRSIDTLMNWSTFFTWRWQWRWRWHLKNRRGIKWCIKMKFSEKNEASSLT